MLRQGAPCWLYTTRNRLVAAPFSSLQFSSSKLTYMCSPVSCSLGRCTSPDQLCALPMSSYQRYLSTTQPKCINFRTLFKRKRTTEQYRKADNLDENHNMVYQAGSIYYIKSMLGTIEVSALFLTGNIVAAALGLIPFPFPLNSETLVYMSMYSFFSYVSLSIARVYPLRIYFNEEKQKFIAVFVGYHPFSIRYLDISPGEVKAKEETYMTHNLNPWGKDICSIKGKQDILLVACNFSSPAYYNMLLGY